MWGHTTSNVSNITHWIRVARTVIQDYRFRFTIDGKILSDEDLNNLVIRLDKILEILESNQSKFNMILNLIHFINNLRGKNN